MCFFVNDTATTEIYTLSLHDALPIFSRCGSTPAPYTAHFSLRQRPCILYCPFLVAAAPRFLYCPFLVDRKSTRLNSSHTVISYAVFCLKKKKNTHNNDTRPAYTTTTPLTTLCA